MRKVKLLGSPRHVRVDLSGRVATLTLSRPHKRNALSRDMALECAVALEDLAASKNVAVLIITGAGDRAFTAGADLAEMRRWGRDEALQAVASTLFNSVERFPKPTIAAVNGSAIGGGCELALACDVRIAADHAKFGQPEVGLGVIPAAGATRRLPRVIGMGRAKHMILTGEPIDANTALAWGLVSAVVPSRQLLPCAHTLARRILTRGPLALRLAKLVLNAASGDGPTGSALEALAQAVCFHSEEKAEGTRAFLEKRKPRFRT